MFNSNIKINKIFILLIFLFCLSIGRIVLAQTNETPLSINAGTGQIERGDKILIFAHFQKTSTIINFDGGETVYFYLLDDKDNKTLFNSCTTPKTPDDAPSCSVEFSSLEIKNFSFTATTKVKGIEYQPEYSPVTIDVTDCIPPKIFSANDNKCVNPTTLGDNGSNSGSNSTDTTYSPLAPLPGLKETIDTSTSCAFGNYLNIMIKLIIGLAAVMAMVMITMGGIEYMTSELISGKEAGKETIQHALLGLVLALSAYLILNTINPKLLNACLDNLPEAIITINGPDAGDDTVDPDFYKGKRVYGTDATVSTGVTSAIQKIKDGWQIVKFTVHTNNKMTIELQKGTNYDYNSVIDIAPGLNGYAPTGTAKTGDKKTPFGEWQIIDVRYIPNQAQFNKQGSNMGAAFWHLSPMTTGERGIGMHGNKRGTLSSTNGCIRLKNADILALQPYIKSGIKVSVKQ